MPAYLMIDDRNFESTLSSILNEKIKERLSELAATLIVDFTTQAKKDLAQVVSSIALELVTNASFSTTGREYIIKVQMPEVKK